MRIKDEARDLHKILTAKNVDINREQIIELLKAQSENGIDKLSKGEPFEIYNIGTITPMLRNGKSNLKTKDNESSEFTTISFSFKIAPEIKRQAKSKIPKV